ncbi:hypothetical protein A2U01_0013583 [Trifolium medium]|uniref:Uncharacterized protein n=1 Tax=Trifolium medium TaxID=97028 RepID=A0A392MZ94_9FABA|nr:hypothetical protein [Trifolium medium]
MCVRGGYGVGIVSSWAVKGRYGIGEGKCGNEKNLNGVSYCFWWPATTNSVSGCVDIGATPTSI